MKKKHHLSMGRFDKRISQGAGRILEKYYIKLSKDGNTILFKRKKDNKLRKRIYITPHGFYDENYRGNDLYSGKPEYVTTKNSKWLLAYYMSRSAKRMPVGGWYQAKGKCCRTRLVQIHVSGYKKQQQFFECQLFINDDWDWKRPILYPFEISLNPKERAKQIRELFSKYHIPSLGIARMIEIYSKHIGREPLIKIARINQIVKNLRSIKVELEDIENIDKNKCSC